MRLCGSLNMRIACDSDEVNFTCKPPNIAFPVSPVPSSSNIKLVHGGISPSGKCPSQFTECKFSKLIPCYFTFFLPSLPLVMLPNNLLSSVANFLLSEADIYSVHTTACNKLYFGLSPLFKQAIK